MTFVVRIRWTFADEEGQRRSGSPRHTLWRRGWRSWSQSWCRWLGNRWTPEILYSKDHWRGLMSQTLGCKFESCYYHYWDKTQDGINEATWKALLCFKIGHPRPLFVVFGFFSHQYNFICEKWSFYYLAQRIELTTSKIRVSVHKH